MMTAQADQNPKGITPEEAAEMIVGNYQMPDVLQANDNDAEGVKEEVRSAFDAFLNIARVIGYSEDKIRSAMAQFMEQNPPGTDLDQKYGAALAGVFDTLEADIPAPSNVDETLWNDLRGTLDNDLFIGNAELRRLTALGRFVKIIQIFSLDAEGQKAVLAHAKDRTILRNGSPEELQQFETAFREAAVVVKQDGIQGLKEFEKELYGN